MADALEQSFDAFEDDGVAALKDYDPARDYQTGQMRASGAMSAGVDEALELPVVMDASHAKGLAQSHIARAWATSSCFDCRFASLPSSRVNWSISVAKAYGGSSGRPSRNGS